MAAIHEEDWSDFLTNGYPDPDKFLAAIEQYAKIMDQLSRTVGYPVLSIRYGAARDTYLQELEKLNAKR